MILITVLLGVEGITGSALAGLYIEGDMNSFTAVLLVILAMGCTFGFTVWFILKQADAGRRSGNPIVKAFAEQLFRDVHGATPTDPTAILTEMNSNMKKLIELMMDERANRPQEPWEGRL